MKKSIMLLSSIFVTTVFSNPASTDYVDKKVGALSESVTKTINQNNTNINNRITPIEVRLSMQPNIILHKIGEHFEGGVIFWLDETLQHGLVVSDIFANENLPISWSNGEAGDKTINAKANGIHSGLMNTNLIISEQTIDDQEGNFAALSALSFKVENDGKTPCTDNSETCFGNWYLPSIYECQLIQKNLVDKNLLTLNESIWTSNEANVSSAYAFEFLNKSAVMYEKYLSLKVRPIHVF